MFQFPFVHCTWMDHKKNNNRSKTYLNYNLPLRVYIYIYILFKLCLLSEFFRGSLSTNSVNTVPWNVNKFSSRYRPVCLPLKNFGRRRGWQLNKHGKALLIGVPLSNIWGICCDAASFRWIIHYHAVIKHRFAETVWEMARLLPHCSLY